MSNKETKLLAPKGEWFKSFLKTFRAADLALQTSSGSDRDYLYQFVNQTLPITFIVVRSAEVWIDLMDPDSIAVGGFTGSDQLVEEGQSLDASNWNLPLSQLDEDAPEPELYLGLTPLSQGALGLEALVGGSIYTSFPRITDQYLSERNLSSKFKIKYRAGSIEGRWRNDPTNVAIVDISSSGTTRDVNQIRVTDILMKPKLVFVGNKLSSIDELRINDLQEKLYQAVQKKGNK